MSGDEQTAATAATQEKKHKKLLVQVGLIVGGIFVFVILGATAMLVGGSLQTYFKAKEELFGQFMSKMQMEAFSFLGPDWFLDYCEEHPGELAVLPSEEETSYWEVWSEEMGASDEDVDGRAEIEKLSPEDQLSYARTMYSYMNDIISVYKWFMPNEEIILFDPNEAHKGFVFAIGDEEMEVDKSGLGTTVVFEPSEHPALKKVLNGSTVMAFEQYKDKENGEYLYIGFRAVRFDSSTRCVLAIVHSWTEMHSDVMRRELIMVVIVGVGLLLMGGLLLLFLNRSVIKPLTKVKQGMQDYIREKDSAKLSEQMSQITQKNELGVLADDIVRMAVEMERSNDENTRLNKERQKVSMEMDMAARIQMDALPKSFPQHDSFEIYASMNPAKDVGGDFYDFFFIGDSQLGMVIADVSDKGVPAALFMMVAKKLIREYATSGLGLEYVMEEANDSLAEGNTNLMFVTAWLGVLDLKTGVVHAVSAGHEYPMLKLASGKFELMKDRHGAALGTMAGMKYKEYTFTMPTDGALFVYTDGAAEATNAAKEMFGTDRMLDALNEDPEKNPKELIGHMSEVIDRFVGDAPQFDDLTMLCVKYRGIPDDDSRYRL